MRKIPYLKSFNFWSSILAVPVILGVLFKLLHIGGTVGSYMLTIGLCGEAIVFLLMALNPEYDEWDWSRAYPELTDENAQPVVRKQMAATPGISQQLDKMMEDANIGPDLIQSLGQGLRSFGTKVENLSSVADVAGSTQDFNEKIKRASLSMEKLSLSYEKASASLADISGDGSNTRAYHDQVNALTKNLSALNAVYEMELQDSSAHLKSMNKFYGNLNETMHNFNESLEDSKQYKDEVAKLAKNLSSLNAVYGNMLSAMNMPRV